MLEKGIKRASSISVAVKKEKDATSHEFRWDTGAATGEENNHQLLPSAKIYIFLLLRSCVMTYQTHSEHEVNWFSWDRKLVMHFSIKKGSGVALKAACKCHHAVAWQQMRRSLVSLFCTAKVRELDFRVLMQMADTVVSSVTLTHWGQFPDVGASIRSLLFFSVEECELPAGQSEPVVSFSVYISVTS